MTMQKVSGIEELHERLYNRDLIACLNMIHIARTFGLSGDTREISA